MGPTTNDPRRSLVHRLWARRPTLDVSRGLINGPCASWFVPPRLRGLALRAWGVDLGERCSVSPGCKFGSADVAIGDDTYINSGVFLDSSAPIRIGARVGISIDTLVITSGHEPGDATRRLGRNTAQPVTIGDGSWIGARVTILPGVTIGPGCVVGAGAVVVGDLEPHGVYAGVPARRLRDL